MAKRSSIGMSTVLESQGDVKQDLCTSGHGSALVRLTRGCWATLVGATGAAARVACPAAEQPPRAVAVIPGAPICTARQQMPAKCSHSDKPDLKRGIADQYYR